MADILAIGIWIEMIIKPSFSSVYISFKTNVLICGENTLIKGRKTNASDRTIQPHLPNVPWTQCY